MANIPTSIYITHLEREGSFIKIWGQTDRGLPVAIEKALQQMTPHFEQGMYSPAIENFQVGIMCCAKFKDELYYRARITNISYLTQGMVEVLFIDYGNRDVISCMNTRTMSGLQAGLISIPAQAKDFILGNVTLPNWDNNWSNFEVICSELRYLEFQLLPILEIGPYTLISLFLNKQNIIDAFVDRGLLLKIPIQFQQATLQPLITRSTPPGLTINSHQLPVAMPVMQPKMTPITATVPTPTLLTYKALPLDNESEHQIYVSYVSDGPCLFSVQLKRMEEQLKRLMTEINCMELQLLEEYPLPGTVCLAQSSEDGYICRAVVTSMVDGEYKVFYVDFGNTELLQFDKLYQIPFKYVIPKVMATRFALVGLENSTVSMEMKCKFKEFVNNRPLFMRVKPAATKSALPLCELWDDSGVKALDMIKQAALLSYPEPAPLNRGVNQEVKVSYVYSCNKIFVQLKAKENELKQLMTSLQETCFSRPLFNVKDLKIGAPCCTIFPDDSMWYRGEILEINGDSFKIKTGIRIWNDLLEELILEQELSMRIVEIQSPLVICTISNIIMSLPCCWRRSPVRRLRSNDDNWNEQPQTETHDRFQKTNNRNDESEWNSPETSENKSYGYKRFDDQRGRRNNSEQTNNNDDWGAKDNENKNFHPRGGGGGGKRNDFEGKGGFNRRDDGFEKKDGFQRRDGFKRKDDFERREGGFEKGDGGFDRRGKRDGFEKRDDFERRDGFHKRGDGFGKRDDFERKDGFKKFNRNQSGEERKFDSYGKGNRNFNDNRSGDDGFVKHKGRDFKKDGSEKSWSDTSEKSWKKGPKSFDKPRGGDKFGSSRKGFAPPSTNNEATLETEDWGTGAAPSNDTNATYDYATETDQFEIYSDLSGTTEAVSISWFYNPINFYCQLDKNKIEFKEMMEEIQQNYRNRQSAKLNPGSSAVVPFSEDGALYRAEIISNQFNQYHVRYVDYGNVATVNKVYPIEKKYMKIPAQAIPCGLGGGPLRFDSFVEDRYCVQLNHDGKSISDLLNEASLTIPTQATVNIDINLLINQQIMIVLRNVASLSDITVEIESGVTVKTAMHNLTSATETYEDSLKQWMGHYLIMYVDGVLEDSLEITLYDLTGQKLQIINPDEGAYDNVEPLCPLPIYSNIIEGWVSHASAESIYIQPSKFADVIAQVLESLYEHYSAIAQEEVVTPEEGQMFAVLSSDSNWYRGNVTEVKEDAAVVTFVDYGNSELVPFENLRELSPQFYQPHMLAVEILIPGDKEQYLEQEIAVSVVYGSLGWEGEVVADNDTERAEPQSALPETKLPQIGIESEIIQEEVPQEEAVITPPIGFNVVISHIDTPNEFYLQQSEAAESIALLQEELQEQISNLPNLDNPTAGVLCAAPYFNHWFRALVLDADEDITTVRFVDVGNTDVITNSSAHVKTLPTEMLSIEYHAKLCSLFVKPIGEEWSSAAQDSFLRYKTMENLTAEIVHQDEKTTYVELYANGQNVAEILKQNGLAADLQLETESSSTGFISHLNSPSEFWIQLESSCSDLEWVADQLANAESYPALEDLTPGSLCAAIFSDDDSWYRARILSNTVAGLEVIFIDYGNSCSCNGLRELPEDLIMLPPLALKCSLQKPNGIMQWSQAATDKFKEISADGATVFNVNILTPGETSIVQLTYEDQDVSAQLVPETRQCFVSHVDSVESFWVQFMDDNAKIENLTEAMESADAWPSISEAEAGDLVAALFEDELWYRARILEKIEEEYQVLFIDYGNTTGVAVLRELPEECAKLEALATNFKLDMLPRTKWGDKSDELFTSMTECGVAMFDLEVVAENTARLYLNGLDVRSSLECVKCTPSVSLQSSPKKIQTEATQQVIAEDVEEGGGADVIQVEVDENVEEDRPTEETQIRNAKTEVAQIIGSHLEEIIETVVDKDVSGDDGLITPEKSSSPAESPKKSSIENEPTTPHSTPTGSPKKSPGKIADEIIEEDVSGDDGLITPKSDLSPAESSKKNSSENEPTTPHSKNEPTTPHSTPTGSPKKSPGKIAEEDVSGDDGLITPEKSLSPVESPQKSPEKDVDEPKKSPEKCRTVENIQGDIPKCDTTKQEPGAEEVDTVTTECDKTNKAEEEETCSKDSIAITKDSETGHSPKKDEIVSEGIPDERNESKTQEK
ncbi:tudor domain containing protein [Holotrichia oblita]|uniref:Tudor domain containing protein n=1 Tax=Holotrichia oblita TaxID=644536 RepID=A0ACB9THR0_HOLOL|nr:tudor domain containing protein [Holotrichia oblita]